MAIYAIDFDNTLAITRFPEIIAPNKKMVAFAKAVKAQGHQIILWTSRAGADLENAVEWCFPLGLLSCSYRLCNNPHRFFLYHCPTALSAPVMAHSRHQIQSLAICTMNQIKEIMEEMAE